MGMSNRRQLSATEKMAAIFGPASLLARCSQFFLPIAIARIALSARPVDRFTANGNGRLNRLCQPMCQPNCVFTLLAAWDNVRYPTSTRQ